MASSDGNKGIIQSGGTINVNALALGDQASAHSHGSHATFSSHEHLLQDLATKLQALTQAISQHAESPQQREELDRHASEIREELGKQKPDKSRLTAILERIASVGKSIVPIVELAAKLKSIIVAFL
jgi:DNA repair exonuclease SbcCD ATPase subunit